MEVPRNSEETLDLAKIHRRCLLLACADSIRSLLMTRHPVTVRFVAEGLDP
jgi:hypothetical protein